MTKRYRRVIPKVVWHERPGTDSLAEMANSKPASADSRPEMANSKPSDDKTQQIGHVYNDRALVQKEILASSLLVGRVNVLVRILKCTL